jgi:hypothetical protein
MFRLPVSVILLTCGLLAGCTPTPTTVVVPPKKNTTGPMVAHPEYANWSQFPVGTQVIRRANLASENGDVFQVTTLKLAAKSDQSVTVDSQTTIERAGAKEESEVQSADYPAEFQLPEGMEVSQFYMPALKAKLARQESIQVAGRTYEADVYEFIDTAEAGPLAVTLWRSDAIPGKQAKKQILDPGGNLLSASETIEISLPTEDAGN